MSRMWGKDSGGKMSKPRNGFVIQVVCKEVKAYDKSILTKDGATAWVSEIDGGWVPATGYFCDEIPKEILSFRTYQSAEKFAKKWDGHPWYCVPKSFKIFEVKAVTKEVFSHYELAGKE